jgi:hypothetical protein
LTIQVQEAGACTTRVCAPTLDCEVTDCPDGPVSLMAGVPEACDPAGVTNTWRDGPAAGAGEHRKAQPRLQEAAVVVNGVLVQLPVCCGESRRTRAGPAAAVEEPVVEPPAAVVVVDPPAAVVVVDPAAAPVFVEPPAAVVVLAEPPPAAVVVVAVLSEEGAGALAGGSLPLSVLAPFALDPPPVSPLIHIPKTTATRTAVRSCQVFQDRRSLSLSSPGRGTSLEDSRDSMSEGDVIVLASIMAPVRSSEPPRHIPRNSRADRSGRDHGSQVVMPFDPALAMVDRDDWA